MKKHIVLCGQRQVGKTTMTQRLMREILVPVYGFRTKIMSVDEDGTHHIYMYPAGSGDGVMEESNHIGDCRMTDRTVNLRVFEDLGVRLLREAKTDGVIIMDELGFMEAGAKNFCEEVLQAFDGETPILAAVKDTRHAAEFLGRIRNHKNAELFMLTRENYGEVLEQVLPIVRSWNERNLPSDKPALT